MTQRRSDNALRKRRVKREGPDIVPGEVSKDQLGPSARPNRVSVCMARTLNPIGQLRVTLSQWQEQLRAGLWVTAGAKGA